ncbi:hypothetical protein F4859DRAFT_73479 [Xylaria cf. heliscus]|nr:hypothetical protein F4859DRAFT_73479 [Xylaria cf. heliscus]
MDNFHCIFGPLRSLLVNPGWLLKGGNGRGRITSFIIGIVYYSIHSGTVCWFSFPILPNLQISYRKKLYSTTLPPITRTNNPQTTVYLHSPQLAANRPDHSLEKPPSHTPISRLKRKKTNPSICRVKAEREERRGGGRGRFFSRKQKSHATTKHSHV